MGYVRDTIDLAPLIRSSTVSIVVEIVDGIRSCGVGVPWALEQTVDRLVVRWGLWPAAAETTSGAPPGGPFSRPPRPSAVGDGCRRGGTPRPEHDQTEGDQPGQQHEDDLERTP